MISYMEKTSAYQAYFQTKLLSNKIAWLRVANNVIGLFSLPFSAYISWWFLDLGWWGVIAFIFLIWIINSVILPKLFSKPQLSLAEKAKKHLLVLADLGVIDHLYANQLLSKPVEYWSNHIDKGISDKGAKLITESKP